MMKKPTTTIQSLTHGWLWALRQKLRFLRGKSTAHEQLELPLRF